MPPAHHPPPAASKTGRSNPPPTTYHPPPNLTPPISSIYIVAIHMPSPPSDRELKKGSAELLILSLIESKARHGYEISKQIESRSEGTLRFQVASLYPLLYRLDARGC